MRVSPELRVPASETRGEGIFLQLAEGAVVRWEQSAEVVAAERQLRDAHRHFRKARNIVRGQHRITITHAG